MKTSWYSMIAAAVVAMVLTGCDSAEQKRIKDENAQKQKMIDDKAAADKAKLANDSKRVETNKEVGQDLIDAKAKADKEKLDAETKLRVEQQEAKEKLEKEAANK